LSHQSHARRWPGTNSQLVLHFFEGNALGFRHHERHPQELNGVFFAPVELQQHQEEANRKLAKSLRDAGVPVVLLIAGRQCDAFICANDNTAAVLLRSIESCGAYLPRSAESKSV
jgi:hypothetical protein